RQYVRRKPACGSRLRRARSTHVLPTPGSPRSRTLSRPASASSISVTNSALLSGSQRSASSISFDNGAVRKPKTDRSVDAFVAILLSGEGAARIEVDGRRGLGGSLAKRRPPLRRVGNGIDDPERAG